MFKNTTKNKSSMHFLNNRNILTIPILIIKEVTFLTIKNTIVLFEFLSNESKKHYWSNFKNKLFKAP
jgi:hypothetical protein